MRPIVRFCTVVFIIAALVGVGLLAAAWLSWAPIAPAASMLLAADWFFAVECILLGVVAVGLVVLLVRVISAPSTASRLHSTFEDGEVVIMRKAISSTARNVAESYPGVAIENVHVTFSGRRNPTVSAYIKANPGENGFLGILGEEMQRDIAETLAEFTGHDIGNVSILFTGHGQAVAEKSLDEVLARAASRQASPDGADLQGSASNVGLHTTTEPSGHQPAQPMRGIQASQDTQPAQNTPAEPASAQPAAHQALA